MSVDQSTEPAPVGHKPHVMMAGDSRDLPELRSILSRLPADSYGQVFIEIVSSVQVVPLAVPAGVTVTWLRRDLASGASHGTFGAARGESLERAVLAWAAEWLEAECQCGQAPFYLWIGCAMSPSVNRLHVALHVMLDTSAASQSHHH